MTFIDPCRRLLHLGTRGSSFQDLASGLVYQSKACSGPTMGRLSLFGHRHNTVYLDAAVWEHQMNSRTVVWTCTFRIVTSTMESQCYSTSHLISSHLIGWNIVCWNDNTGIVCCNDNINRHDTQTTVIPHSPIQSLKNTIYS